MANNIRFDADQKADSFYIHFSDKKISYSIEVSPDLVIDVAEDESVVGFDFQHLTETLKEFKASRGTRSIKPLG